MMHSFSEVMRWQRFFAVFCLVCTIIGVDCTSAMAVVTWNSPNRYRVMLSVNPLGVTRTNSPASVDIDFPQLLTNMNAAGTFDPYTVEVITYNSSGQPLIFDSTRNDYERYLLPHRIQNYYPIKKVTLSFVIPDQTYTQYAVYFDTVESGLGKPQRYTGLVGNGDFFREEYKRREINASHFDQFVDFDNDGDLDLFKAGVEPFVYVYENVGANKFVDRGRLTSNGQVLELPSSADKRSWMSVAFCDWDGDGDQDFFPSFGDSPDAGKIVYYKNTTAENAGKLTFTRINPLATISGTLVAGGAQAGGWFPTITFVRDWDGDNDGRIDVIVGSNNHCYLYRNLGPDGSGGWRLADAVTIKANGSDIVLSNPRFDCADIDNDGDYDLFGGCQPGNIYMYRNTGTRTAPVFAAGVVVAYDKPCYITDAHSGIKIADWDGDGLLDIVVGRFWERTPLGDEGLPRYFGGLYKNIGTATEPLFAKRDAYNGSPYTEQFQKCDAVRQNGVRTVDWNNDGKPDLIAGDTDGYVWYFRNLTGRFFPVFATGERLKAAGQFISMMNNGGHARPDIADWDNDGKPDLIVANGDGRIMLFRNTGTDANPVLAVGTWIYAGGSVIDSPGSRSSVIVCDWDNDGKKDIIQADDTGYYFYENTNTDAAPVFAAGVIINPGGQAITYTRPNVGSYVDWNGDGKKDFIACNFENNVRYYKNTGSGGYNVEPRFSNSTGVTILQDYSIMMISGADVKDWNNDGDMDILTGQGHGGSGLRFYERDYINDKQNSTFPVVTVGSAERTLKTSEAKALADGGTEVSVSQSVVTAIGTGYLYIQSQDQLNGIRVQKSAHGKSIDQIVNVLGVLSTNQHGERYITANMILDNGLGSVSSITLSNKSLGGGNLLFNPPATPGQRGVTGGSGANNIGILVGSYGRCTLNLANPNNGGDFNGSYYMFIDDGSGIMSLYKASDGSYKQANGIKVEVNDPSIGVGNFILARGISSIELVNGKYQSRLLPRPGQNDIIKL